MDEAIRKKQVDYYKNLIQKIFNDFSHVIFAADKHFDAYKFWNLENSFSKIYYGFEKPKKIQPVEFKKGASFVFGMIARGDRTKGWAEAIEAFKILKTETNRRLKLVLVGDSDYLRQLKKENQDSDIIFAGATDNPLGWIYHFDVGLLPTYFPAESLPNSVIEYLAMGKPVIATDWAEIPQMIDSEQGRAGLLVRFNNNKPDIFQLAELMYKLLTDKSLYAQLKTNTAMAFSKFSLRSCAKNYLNLFAKYL